MYNYSTRIVCKVVICCFLMCHVFQASAQNSNKQIVAKRYYSDPSISPDGTEIAFVSGGDIWTVPAQGLEARLLLSHPDNESRPLYSPDGKYLAFISSRTGGGDIYIFSFATGQVKRLTYDDLPDDLSAWSSDSRYIYFASVSRDIAGMRDVFKIKVDGGTPMPVTDDRYTTEFFAQPSPDGKSIAFTARGFGAGQWWRNGRSHLDESELWVVNNSASPTYQKIAERGAKQLWPMWSRDGKNLYYVSDRTGTQNLWMQPLNGTAKKLTNFDKGRVLWPTISANGNTIVFERNFGIWRYDIASAQPAEVKITLRGSPASPAVDHQKLTAQFRGLGLSPDAKKVAFIARGEVFVASAKDGGDALRVTNSVAPESQLLWASNSNNLVYVSDRDGTSHLYQFNFLTRQETQLTNGLHDDVSPLFSPDGKTLAFIRNNQELRSIDIASRKETLVAKGYLSRPPFPADRSITWSPDGKWIAYLSAGAKNFTNVYVVPAMGGDAKQVSFLANSFSGSVSWGADNFILFSTRQRTENGYIARIDLTPQLPRFKEDQFRDMFSEPAVKPTEPAVKPASEKTNPADTMFKASVKVAKSSSKTAQINFENIRQRLSLISVGVDVNDQVISKDGKTLLISASPAGQQNLYTYSLDELSKEPAVLKQLTSTPGGKSDMQFSADGKEVYYLEQGRIQSINVESKQAKAINVTAELDVDFAKEKLEIFKEAWEGQNKGFYDPKFHGVDWNAVRREYEPFAAGANTPDELRRILNLMVGELNASHSGISGPGGGAGPTTGRIGLRFDRIVYENEGKFKIIEIIDLGPTAITGQINVGDFLTAIDDVQLTSTSNLDQILENKINRKVDLTIAPAGNSANQKTVAIRPTNSGTEKGLLYKQWVKQRRDYVSKISNGRLGYVHMFDMGQGSLDQLHIDLDEENHSKDGVVVDVRNNNGGFVNAYALDVLSRKSYLTMTNRGMPAAPARSQLGQRSLESPTILVTNQHSLSDAEDFTEGYREMKLGKVVGEPTSGWIVFTSAMQLIDGTNMRMPFIKITDNEGKNMELAPRPVDVFVSNPIGESYKKTDSQLDVAVKELIKQLDTTKKQN